jgi:MFS family permease
VRRQVEPIGSHRGLDGVNFFVAAVQTGFGAFVTVYLVKNQWPPQAIGFALTISTISSLLSQIPAGAVLDGLSDKRRAVLLGIAGVGLAALLLSFTAAPGAVYLALAMQGLASSLIGPGIAAISLTLVGQAALSERIGRNARFAALGNGLAAGLMGIAGAYLPPTVSVFPVAGVLALPALWSLTLIGSESTERAVTQWQPSKRQRQDDTRITWQGMKSLILDKRLAIFAACVVLFFAASAAMGPVVTGRVTRRWPDFATLIVAGLILLPQAIVAAISPWVGRRADHSGRRSLLLRGWALIPVQGLLYAAFPGPFALVLGNMLNAVSGAIFGVTMTVIAADLTRQTGCFNLTLGGLGVAISVGASLSTFFTGILVAAFGARMAVLGLGLVGLCGLLLLWALMPETRPQDIALDRTGSQKA